MPFSDEVKRKDETEEQKFRRENKQALFGISITLIFALLVTIALIVTNSPELQEAILALLGW